MKKKSNLYIVILFGLLILQLFTYHNRLKEQKKEAIMPSALVVQSDIKSSHFEASNLGNTTSNMEDLVFEQNPTNEYYQINPDYVGWLKIEDTAIDYPVVRGLDNSYYLNHNFYMEEDILGTIFMDARNMGMGLDKHSIMYGHYSKHGQMFKDLDRYLSEEFLLSHPEFTFTDAFSKRTYKVFSVHYSDADPDFINLSFEEDEFTKFITWLKDKSLFQIDTNISPEDTILTLVTCNFYIENGRLFVHAVEVID